MLESMLAMLGIEPKHVEGLKTTAMDFHIRFAALESKVNFLFYAHPDCPEKAHAPALVARSVPDEV